VVLLSNIAILTNVDHPMGAQHPTNAGVQIHPLGITCAGVSWCNKCQYGWVFFHPSGAHPLTSLSSSRSSATIKPPSDRHVHYVMRISDFSLLASCFTKRCVFNLILIYGSKNTTNNYRLVREHDEGALDVLDSSEVGANVDHLLWFLRKDQNSATWSTTRDLHSFNLFEE
jgi:hypothetical protein